MVILVMGVAGSGKTTVGKLLASQLKWEFADADDYHPAANVEKMRAGIPLEDADRAPWIETLRGLISEWIADKKNGVLACSALKRTYRENLKVAAEVEIVYLKGTPPLFHERLLERAGHFMKDQMLQSQLATLEEPENEDLLTVDAALTPAQIAAEIRSSWCLKLSKR